MKKLILIAGMASMVVSCNNKTESTTESKTDSSAGTSASTETIDLPYKVDHEPDYWEMGDLKNVALVLNSLKAYENGDVEEALKPFADTVRIGFDYFQGRISKDSLRAMLVADRAKTKSMKISMDDFESVRGKDKKEEWVTLWYKGVWTDKSGKTDSLTYVDDAKIENGKIAVLDEKIQHFAKPKK